MTITLVRTSRGYIGRTFSDRWNLATLGLDSVHATPRALATVRRILAGVFTIVVCRSPRVLAPTTVEYTAVYGGQHAAPTYDVAVFA